MSNDNLRIKIDINNDDPNRWYNSINGDSEFYVSGFEVRESGEKYSVEEAPKRMIKDGINNLKASLRRSDKPYEQSKEYYKMINQCIESLKAELKKRGNQ